ncbi:glycosyltransferase family 2 protein [Bacillus sp. AFS040349]|uniref:glycosyltransferase family 2 protein n=2 Tax=Bacillaceae TaxID=186817 RepID=UPI001C3F14CE|nr:glycosyltransferase [Bacillus sp. AFS040349]
MKNDSFITRNIQTPKEIEVSIIIPSYNKYPLNLITLYSLEKQHFDLSKVEVFLLDDASTDQTPELLENYHPPYHFHYIRCKSNNGRAKVRNLGIQQACGKVIIFLDAEMYVEPSFIQNHYQYHQQKNNLIVTGAMSYNALYSCIFPSFKPEQVQEIKEMIKGDPKLSSRSLEYQHSLSTPFPLLENSDFDDGSYKTLCFEKSSWFSFILEQYGSNLDGFSFPWMAFLTGNVSLRKSLLDKVGGFDEDFVGYGYEDWELGYRLYEAGAEYLASDKVISYHQEHPISSDNWQEAIENYYLFLTKHPDIDVLILGIELSQLANLYEMNEVLMEYYDFLENDLYEFLLFNKMFIKILVTISLLLKIDVRHKNILGATGLSIEQKNDLLSELMKLNKLNRYNKLTKLTEKIIFT